MSEDDPRAIIGAWWASEIGTRERSEARALAARLRRASDIEALTEPQVHTLAGRLNRCLKRGIERNPERLAQIVRVLAEVRTSDGRSLARKLGTAERDRGSAHLRFQRLMRSEGADLEQAVRRVLPLVDRACNPGRLGADLLFWDDKVRTRWAFDYFGADAPQKDETA